MKLKTQCFWNWCTSIVSKFVIFNKNGRKVCNIIKICNSGSSELKSVALKVKKQT